MELDVTRYLGAVVREVASREHEGKPARVMVIRRDYDTGLDDLWDAITSAERIPRWFLPITGDLRLGGRYQLQGNAGGTVTACDPPRHLEATWEFGGGVSWIAVTLAEAAGGGARLTLEHISHVEGDFWDKFGPGATGVGWELGLIGLALHLETGAAVSPDAFQQWSASEGGKAFARGSAAAWGQAAIAGGDPPEAALAAAERTAGFYTGEG